MSDYDTTGIQTHTIPDFKFSNGTTLHHVRVAYRSINPTSKAGTILIPTCFGGRINTTLTFTGPTPVNALAKYHVIVAAMLGNGESSSPSNTASFPSPGELRYEDVINAHYHLLTEGLRVDSLEAVVGFSMGAQQAYYWGVLYPNFVKRIVPICGSARTSGHSYAFVEGPIIALTNSIDYIAWKQAKTMKADSEQVFSNLAELWPVKGLQGFARAYAAWLTSAEWFDQGLWRSAEIESVEEWIKVEEEDNLSWDADDLLVLARMWQMGDIGSLVAKEELSQLGGRQGNDEKLKEALGSIQARVLLMPCWSDQYFRPGANEEEVKYLKHGKLAVIKSVWGHIAGGGGNPEDVTFMNREIEEFMA
jgi:homoserine acetyltransferase